jgi:hypothetical protein
MVRNFLLIVALATPAGLLAQYQVVPSSQAPPSQVPPPSSTVVVPSTNIYVVGGGLYGTGVYFAQPAAVAPAESTSTTGISLAGHAGISLMNPPSAPTAFAPAAVTGYSGGYAGYSSTPATVEPEPSGRLINDVGPSYFRESMTSAGGAPAVSLGEVAAQYRANRPQGVRTYTNVDAQRLSNKVGVSGATPTESRPAPATPPPPQSRPEPTEPPH